MLTLCTGSDLELVHAVLHRARFKASSDLTGLYASKLELVLKDLTKFHGLKGKGST